jgi:hypothetical protein
MHYATDEVCENPGASTLWRSNAKRGYPMTSRSKLVRFVLCSKSIVLECKCEERLVLLGREEDWHLEGRTTFECECGSKLTLGDRVEVPLDFPDTIRRSS